METEMTWKAICKDSSGNIIHKVINAPHGTKDAWSVIAIISGMHDIYHAANDE